MVISRLGTKGGRRAGVGLVGLVGLGLLLAGCGGRDIGAFESLKGNPMATPTLSFASPTFISGTAGSGTGIQSQSIIITRFTIDESRMEAAENELLAQAVAAGFEVELLDSFGSENVTYASVGNPSPSLSFGTWLEEGQAMAGVTLRQ